MTFRASLEVSTSMSAGWGKSACPVGGGARQWGENGMRLLRHGRENPDTELCRNLKQSVPRLLDWGLSNHHCETYTGSPNAWLLSHEISLNVGASARPANGSHIRLFVMV